MKKQLFTGLKLCALALLMFLAWRPVFAQAQNSEITVTVSRDLVRFAAPGDGHEIRIEVFSQTGEKLFDSDFVAAQTQDWRLKDLRGQTVENGLYAYTVTIKDKDGALRTQRGNVIVGRVTMEREIELTSGGIKFPDNTVQTTAANGGVAATGAKEADGSGGDTETKPESRSINKQAAAAASVTGSGTPGKIAIWTDGSTIGSSKITESSSGNVGIEGDLQFGSLRSYGTLSTPGRMHVTGGELLYLLNKNGVIIGKEWGGNGNLMVQGNLDLRGTLSTPGRMHVTGGELLYLLNKNGVIIGKEWGGNGNLMVQGDLTLRSSRTIIQGFDGSGIHWFGPNPDSDLAFGIRRNGPGNYNFIVNVLEVTGGSDLAEPFEISDAEELKPGMVVTIDPERPGRLRIADKAYDRTVAGIISGANGIKPGLTMKQEGSIANGSHPVALTGRVYCWADASNGPIEPGDMLTTSGIAGHAMKVTDHAKAQGAIIGKAMTGLKESKGLVLVLVSLQ